MNRRRVLGMMAVAMALVPSGARGRSARRVHWRGTALGAEATLVIDGIGEARARRLIELVLAEVDRLEAIFSLHRSGSSLTVLNRSGRLRAPPHELVDLLAEARRIHRLSAGVFDPSVQPLWRLHARHFASGRAAPDGPSPAAVARTLRSVGLDRVVVERREIRFTTPDMALTLNGIAQGAIADRVADLLRNEGLAHVLVDLGEIVAVGPRASGRPWSLAVSLDAPPEARLALADRAVATSDPGGTVFDRARGRHHHLLDPRTGRSSAHARPVTVVAPRAATADALSTALALMPPDDAGAIARLADREARIIRS